MTALPAALVELMRGRALCFLTTLMPDGSPQVTETWVDNDGDHIVVNTVTTHQKMRNIARDPRVAVAFRYLGRPYPGFGGSGQRVVVTIGVDKVHSPTG